MAAPVLSTPSTPGAGGRVTFGSILRSELTKLRSVRSTYWTLLTALVLMVLIGSLATNATAAKFHKGTEGRDFDPMLFTFVGIQLAQLAIAVLGVLAITSEYGTGMIRTTFTAVPQRLKLLAAKATAFGTVTLVASTVLCFVVFFIGQAIYSSEGLHYSLVSFQIHGYPSPGRTLVGAIVYLLMSGLIGFGLGALIRRTPGAIVAVVVLQFVIGPILFAIGSAAGGIWNSLPAWLPTEAGHQAFFLIHHDDHAVNSPWLGLAVMVAWAAAFLAAAAVLLRSRDV